MDTFTNEKINTKLAFPNVLDLKPFTLKGVAEKEGTTEEFLKDEKLAQYMTQEDDLFIYKLVGVTIHTGGADSGHYYSIINTARGSNEVDPYTKEE